VPRIERDAEAVWEGNAAEGHGTIRGGTGALRDVVISLPTRFGEPEGHTSPEELVAAAQAGCFAMALSAGLSKAGTPPQRLDASARLTLDEVDGANRVTTVEISVRGRVPGIDQAQFEDAARAAEEACPIANLLRGSADVKLMEARLDS
jgi:lipoyl-dependent peroxiredoxin